MGWFRKPDVNALLDAVVDTRDDPAANVAACREAIKVLTEREHGEIWAVVASIYAQALSEVQEPDLDRSVEQARAIGSRALQYCERHVLHDQVISTRHRVGNRAPGPRAAGLHQDQEPAATTPARWPP